MTTGLMTMEQLVTSGFPAELRDELSLEPGLTLFSGVGISGIETTYQICMNHLLKDVPSENVAVERRGILSRHDVVLWGRRFALSESVRAAEAGRAVFKMTAVDEVQQVFAEILQKANGVDEDLLFASAVRSTKLIVVQKLADRTVEFNWCALNPARRDALISAGIGNHTHLMSEWTETRHHEWRS